MTVAAAHPTIERERKTRDRMSACSVIASVPAMIEVTELPEPNKCGSGYVAEVDENVYSEEQADRRKGRKLYTPEIPAGNPVAKITAATMTEAEPFKRKER